MKGYYTHPWASQLKLHNQMQFSVIPWTFVKGVLPLIRVAVSVYFSPHPTSRQESTTKKNNKCKLCDNRGDIFNHIMSECGKLAQKENKSWYDWVGKVIHWELCKRLLFDHSKKWHKQKPDFFKSIIGKWNSSFERFIFFSKISEVRNNYTTNHYNYYDYYNC